LIYGWVGNFVAKKIMELKALVRSKNKRFGRDGEFYFFVRQHFYKLFF